MLVQTLVMAAVLSMIAVIVMQWVLGRYLIGARTYRSNASKTHADGYFSTLSSDWKDNLGAIPPSGNTIMDGKNLKYSVSVSSLNVRTVKIETDEDQ